MKTNFSNKSLVIPNTFFSLTLQLSRILSNSCISSFRVYSTKFHVNFLYKPQNSKLPISLNIYQKLNLYCVQSSFQKQQFNLFSEECFLFQFLDFINNSSSSSIIQNNPRPNNVTLISDKSEEKKNQQNTVLLDKDKITEDSFFSDFLVNNYWFDCFDKKFLNRLVTFTGENWYKLHILLKKKLLLQLKFNPHNSRLLNYFHQLNEFFQEKLSFKPSFISPSLNPPSKKSVVYIWNLFLFEFHQKLYKLQNFSPIYKMGPFEKNCFNIQCLKLNFLFQAVPVFLNKIFMQNLNSFDFLPKTNRFFLKSVKKTKLQFFSFKQFLNKYSCFYLNQRVSVDSPFISLYFPCIKFVSNSYCSPFNSLYYILKFLRKMPFTSLSRFSLNLDFQVYPNFNLKNSQNPFVLNLPKQKLNLIYNFASVHFLKSFKCMTFYSILTLRKASTKQPLKQNSFEVCLWFQNLNISQIMFELKTILFNLMKKQSLYCFYFKTTKGLSKCLNQKKWKLLNLWVSLKKTEGLFFNRRKLDKPFLWNKSKSLFKNLFFSMEKNRFLIFIKNQSKKLDSLQFLLVFNNWILQNYPQIPPIIINKQKTLLVFEKEKVLNTIYLKNLKRNANDSSLKLLSFHYNESFLGLLTTTGLYSILPNELTVVQHLNLLKKYIKFSATQTQELLMKNVHPKIYAWCYFCRFTSLNSILYSLDNQLLKWLWRWACRRHNNKSKKWIQSKYYYKFNQKNWVFGTIVLENSLKNAAQLREANAFVLPLFSYFPFHSQILWNLKKASN